MNVNAAIVDQRLAGIADEVRAQAEAELGIKDAERRKTLAFVYLCVKTMLDLEPEEAFDCLTEGGGDFGVDAMHMTEESDGEFGVTLFQAKYKAKLEGDANFPESGIDALVDAIRHLFDPASALGAINDRLKAKVESVRAMIRDGFIPLVCSDFSYNALQSGDYRVKVENLQIVNGGQTSMTIARTLDEMQAAGQPLPADASVLVRIYKLPKDNRDIVLQITHATNSQNPVDLKDLRSNDEKQRRLETGIADLRFSYRRKRMESAAKPTEITSGAAAEAILAVWRHAPHQAKFLTREHFGKLYDTIFTATLNAAQTIVAVLLYRIAENRRRRPEPSDPPFVRYASRFAAMQMGGRLLADVQAPLDGLDHRGFARARALIEERGERYFADSIADVEWALKRLYGEQQVSMQQLSATFRRGDLIDMLRRRKRWEERDSAPKPEDYL